MDTALNQRATQAITHSEQTICFHVTGTLPDYVSASTRLYLYLYCHLYLYCYLHLCLCLYLYLYSEQTISFHVTGTSPYYASASTRLIVFAMPAAEYLLSYFYFPLSPSVFHFQIPFPVYGPYIHWIYPAIEHVLYAVDCQGVL